MLESAAMEELTRAERQLLIDAIASREGTAKQLSHKYGYSVPELREFTEANLSAIEAERAALDAQATNPGEVTPTQLDELWISNKFERLKRYQAVADDLFNTKHHDATTLRELRSFMMAAANELGQLLHRGSGDSGTGDVATYDIQGVDLENLR